MVNSIISGSRLFGRRISTTTPQRQINSLFLKYAKNPDYPPCWSKNKIEPFLEGNAFLDGCQNIQLKLLDHGVQAIVLPQNRPTPFLEDDYICPNVIYTREFYPSLLSKLLSSRRSILISNSGVGKSVFQFYMLALFSSPEKFSHSIPPPELVIRQVDSKFEYYLLKEKASFVSSEPCPLYQFDPKRCLFFYEPGSREIGPEFLTHRLPIISTVSSLPSRYKELEKNGGICSFMPLFTLEELLVIGADMRERENFPPEIKDFYSDKLIRDRFKAFGGIIRHVLPTTKDNADVYLKKRDSEIKAIDCVSLLNCQEIRTDRIGHLTLAYQVKRSGKSAFQWPSLDFVSEEVRSLVEKKTMSLSRSEKIRLLMNATRLYDSFLGSAPKVFEELIAKAITKGDTKSWQYRNNNSNPDKFTDLSLGPMESVDIVKPFSEMKLATNREFPFHQSVFQEK